MTTLEIVLQIVVVCLFLYLWFLAFLLSIKIIYDIPGSAFSRDKQRNSVGGDEPWKEK